MNNRELTNLANDANLTTDENRYLCIALGVACIERVESLLTDSFMIEMFEIGKAYVNGTATRKQLSDAAVKAAAQARSHPGSGGLDGAGNAAVSASHGVAAALQGRAIDAAGYAAYASVYSYSSHAVTDPQAYEVEHSWQIAKLRQLMSEHTLHGNK